MSAKIKKDLNNGNYIKDQMPFEKFEKIDHDVIAFYMKYNQLKNLYRQGWLTRRLGLEHQERCASVADHSFSMALLALTMIEKYQLPYDPLKCLKMCIIHELGEVYVGDFTPMSNITKEQKYEKEKEAMIELLNTLDFDSDFLVLWKEFEEEKTQEAKFVKNLDQLEFLMQAAAYGLDVSYCKRSLGKITNEHCKTMAEELIKITQNGKTPMEEG